MTQTVLPRTVNLKYTLDDGSLWPGWVWREEDKVTTADDINRPHEILKIYGSQIQDGDYVECSLGAGGGAWSVYAIRTAHGMGWRRPGSMEPVKNSEYRWIENNKDKFQVRRFKPAVNEFGEVSP